MKNRFSTLSRSAKLMLVLLAAYGVTSSCKDEYTLDDEKPSFLNESIYESLTSQGSYNYYLRLIGDPDVNTENRNLTDILSRTGSRTVFAANDDAWEAFFAENALLPEDDSWHNATSYEKLSRAQKNLLIHTSMLNNAIVMENLSSEQEGKQMLRGRVMRRNTDINVTDSVTWLPSDQLPINHNKENNEPDLWARFRKSGIHLVMDEVPSMMIHFTNEFLKNNNITDNDFSIFMNRKRNTEDVHIYDALLTEKDGVCQNGYLNKTEKVIKPLPNMAEALRMDKDTKIFSHMIDRWSAPFPCVALSKSYGDIMKQRNLPWTDEDTIFAKRYFSDNSYPGPTGADETPLVTRPDGKPFRDAVSDQVGLKFDPGWNGYFVPQSDPSYDMASMYVPNDETLWKYFTQGGGGFNLIQTYYLKEGLGTENGEKTYERPTTDEELFEQIDQIPISTLKALINNIMNKSFVGSVPSKMNQLRDDAQEQLFKLDDVKHITRAILTSNGVIYITNEVFGPADFTSVAAPAFISLTNRIMRWAIYNGQSAGVTDYMGLNYYAYLKAMQSKFAMFIPSDDGMQYYYDPTSFGITIKKGTSSPRVINMSYNSKKENTLPIENKAYAYNPETGVIGEALGNSWKLSETAKTGELVNRLKDILESHTVVLDGENAAREEGPNKYINGDIDQFYLAKNGAPIKVFRETGADGNIHITKVQGAFQVENEERGITGSIDAANKDYKTTIAKGITENNVTDGSSHKNGYTYVLDSPIIPASRSVYAYIDNDRVLAEGESYYDESFAGFSSLCNLTPDDEQIIKDCGLVDVQKVTDKTKQAREMKKYYTFVDLMGIDYNVVFFNNYNYTVFVPSNEAIQDAISHGLPTWESIEADYNSTMAKTLELKNNLEDKMKDKEYESNNDDILELQRLNNLLSVDSIRLQAKITYLTNFIRYHFADISVFVDNSNFDSREYVTSSFDSKKGLFAKINVQRQGGQLMVKDANGGQWATVQGKFNLMARDIICNKKPDKKSMSNITIKGTSFSVIHQIPTCLNHTSETERYDRLWATPDAARNYLKRYAIPALNN